MVNLGILERLNSPLELRRAPSPPLPLIERFIIQKVNILEHSNIVILKGQFKTHILSAEQSLSTIKGQKYWYIKKVNFITGHPVVKSILWKKR